MTVPKYPTMLLDVDWQKHKGVIAKIVKGETGIGERLKKFEALHKQTKWWVFDPREGSGPPKPRTREELNVRLAEAKKVGGSIIEAYRKECFALKSFLEAEAKKMSNPLLKSTKAHILKMAEAALALATAARSIDMSGFEAVEAEIKKTEAVGRKMIDDWIKSCEAGIKKVRAKPTMEEYNASLHQKVRGLNTALARIPEYQDWCSKNWTFMSIDRFRDGKKDGEEIKKLADTVEAQLKKFKAIYNKG